MLPCSQLTHWTTGGLAAAAQQESDGQQVSLGQCLHTRTIPPVEDKELLGLNRLTSDICVHERGHERQVHLADEAVACSHDKAGQFCSGRQLVALPPRL